MDRPLPTKALVLGLARSDAPILGKIYAGFREVPIPGLYLYLDFHEAIAFSLGLRDARTRKFRNLVGSTALNTEPLANLAIPLIMQGKSILYPYRNISEDLDRISEAINPFKGKHLAERLSHVDAESDKQWRVCAGKPAYKYVSWGQYDAMKRMRRDMMGIVVLEGPFPNYFRGHERTYAEHYAAAVARAIRKYPREVVELEDNSPQKTFQQDIHKPQKFVQCELVLG